jgi:transcriptional regulator with XRE-family HTH domain
MSQKKRYSKVSDMVEATASPDFAEAFKKQVAERQLIQKLQLLRVHCGLSQADVADRLKCTQSKISKLESGKDNDLSIGDLLGYANATGYGIQIVFIKEDEKLVDEVKYHFFETKKLMERLVELADVDEDIAKGIAGFFGEACLNFVTMLLEKVKKLPPQARDHIPLVKLVSEIGESKPVGAGGEAKQEPCCNTNGHNGATVMV